MESDAASAVVVPAPFSGRMRRITAGVCLLNVVTSLIALIFCLYASLPVGTPLGSRCIFFPLALVNGFQTFTWLKNLRRVLRDGPYEVPVVTMASGPKVPTAVSVVVALIALTLFLVCSLLALAVSVTLFNKGEPLWYLLVGLGIAAAFGFAAFKMGQTIRQEFCQKRSAVSSPPEAAILLPLPPQTDAVRNGALTAPPQETPLQG